MTTVFTRIVELIGWIVFGISALLLVIAHHIDNYQSPTASGCGAHEVAPR
ncbi:division septum protein Blr [Klebsiella pneumoniae subsp. pneumoniae]|nr:division septum protein Blr [Klebsiella pneumoniae subsp. pneumoniae]